MFSRIFIGFLFLLWISAPLSLGQTKIKQLGDAITLVTECQSQKEIQLRLHNFTDWPIAVSTFSSYSSMRKSRSLKLSSGTIVSAMPNNKEISSLFYWIEREIKPVDGKRVFEVFGTAGDSYDVSWIAPKDSIMFSVPIDLLPQENQLFVKYNFDWELGGNGRFFSGGNEHRVFYRGNSPNFPEHPNKCKNFD